MKKRRKSRKENTWMNNPMGRKQKGENLTTFSRKPAEPGRILTWCFLLCLSSGWENSDSETFGIIAQLSSGNKLSSCLTSTLNEWDLAVKVSYLSLKIPAHGHRLSVHGDLWMHWPNNLSVKLLKGLSVLYSKQLRHYGLLEMAYTSAKTLVQRQFPRSAAFWYFLQFNNS